MKTFIDYIIKILIFIIVFLTVLFWASVFYAYLSSDKNDISLENTVSYVQSIGNTVVNYKFADKNSVNLLSNTPVNSTPTLTQTNYGKIKYYYYQLDDNAKIIYKSLENNIDNLKKDNFTIDFSKTFNDLLHEYTGQEQLNKSFQSALDAFFYDYPELFYIDLTKISLIIKSSSIGSLTTYTVSISPKDDKNYLYSDFNNETDVDVAISKIENVRTNLINNLSSIGSDYNRILKLHDNLVNSLEYDSTLNKANTHNIYGALVQNSVVCEGYAKAFKYILDSIDIENILVSGTATNSSGETEAHMWNYVKICGNWYGVDITWDDPIIIGGFQKNNLRHDYFLKGSRTFVKSHTPSGKISNEGMLFSLPDLCKDNYD